MPFRNRYLLINKLIEISKSKHFSIFSFKYILCNLWWVFAGYQNVRISFNAINQFFIYNYLLYREKELPCVAWTNIITTKRIRHNKHDQYLTPPECNYRTEFQLAAIFQTTKNTTTSHKRQPQSI